MRFRIPYQFLYVVLLCLGISVITLVNKPPPSHYVHYQTIPLRHNSTSRLLIIGTKSRLGNNMFQYASGIGIAKRNGLKPVVFSQQKHNMAMYKAFMINTYNISKLNQKDIHWVNQTGFSTSYNKETESLNSLSRNLNKHILLNGHWRSYRYFRNLPDEMLHKIFTFRPTVMSKAQAFLRKSVPKNLKNKDIVYVGVHIRLTDRGTEWGKTKATSKEKYLKDAAKFYDDLYDNVLFVVCSDDIPKAKQVFPGGYNVVYSGNVVEVDMAILASCNHTIMTVGSFGWWVGRLAGGQVVYYGNHNFHNYLTKKYIREHVYPSNWIAL